MDELEDPRLQDPSDWLNRPSNLEVLGWPPNEVVLQVPDAAWTSSPILLVRRDWRADSGRVLPVCAPACLPDLPPQNPEDYWVATGSHANRPRAAGGHYFRATQLTAGGSESTYRKLLNMNLRDRLDWAEALMGMGIHIQWRERQDAREVLGSSDRLPTQELEQRGCFLKALAKTYRELTQGMPVGDAIRPVLDLCMSWQEFVASMVSLPEGTRTVPGLLLTHVSHEAFQSPRDWCVAPKYRPAIVEDLGGLERHRAWKLCVATGDQVSGQLGGNPVVMASVKPAGALLDRILRVHDLGNLLAVCGIQQTEAGLVWA